jgi:hypothetical protein
VSRAEEKPLRCDACGCFVGWRDIESGAARHVLVTPDSEFTREEFETICRDCHPGGGEL